jgi:uncharacterized membrane protein
VSNRPRSITIIGWVFLVFGILSLVVGLLPTSHISAAQRLVEIKSHWYVHVSRITGAIAGLFMLYGFNWARWLLVLWLAFHVFVGLLHSSVQMLTHSLLMVIVVYFIFRPRATAFFQSEDAAPPAI